MDGFDDMANTAYRYSYADTVFNASTDTPFSYGRSLDFSASTDSKISTPVGTATAVFVHFWLKTYGAADLNENVRLEFYDSNAAQMQIDIRLKSNKITNSVDFLVYRGGSTLIQTWSVPRVKLGFWNNIGVKVTLDPSSGVVALMVDGKDYFQFTGNTMGTPNMNIDLVRLRTLSVSGRVLIDDLIIGSGAYGDSVLSMLRVFGANVPVSAVASQWTPSSGLNWQTVDEIPPNDTDYNYSATSGQVDLFSHGALPSTLQNVSAVQPRARCWVPETGSSDQIYMMLQSSGINTSASAVVVYNNNVTNAYQSIRTVFHYDPATSAGWTPGAATAAYFGYKKY